LWLKKGKSLAANYAGSTTATNWTVVFFIFVTFSWACFFRNPNLLNIRLPSKIVIAFGRQNASFGETPQVG
jgi:hypothetical protein